MAYQTIPIKASSNIATVAWEAETKSLLVTFIRQGRQGVYHDVDSRTAEGFRTADSPGRYLNTFVKPFFEYEEL